MKLFGIEEYETVCANCRNFHQHYAKDGEIYKAINAGHCVYPRVKSRKPGMEGCEHWEER